MYPASFFKVSLNESSSRSEQDFDKDLFDESLNEKQNKFVKMNYPEYYEKSPYSVLEWLYNKAISY